MTNESVRIDKWLWAARFFKTRSMATDAVDTGKIKLNGDRVKPARGVKPGDRLEIDNGSTAWEVVVKELSDVDVPPTSPNAVRGNRGQRGNDAPRLPKTAAIFANRAPTSRAAQPSATAA